MFPEILSVGVKITIESPKRRRFGREGRRRGECPPLAASEVSWAGAVLFSFEGGHQTATRCERRRELLQKVYFSTFGRHPVQLRP